MANKIKFNYIHFTSNGLNRSYEWVLGEGYPLSIEGIDATFAVVKTEREWLAVNLDTGYQVGLGKTRKAAIEMTTKDLQRHGNKEVASAIVHAHGKGFIPPPVPTSEDCAGL